MPQVGAGDPPQRGDKIAAMRSSALAHTAAARRLGARLGAAVVLALAAPLACAQGTTVVIGGALADDNRAVWSRLARLVKAPGARSACYSVIATASGEPLASARRVGRNLARHGGRGRPIVGAAPAEGQAPTAAAHDPASIRRVLSCRGVFFTGGAQERLLNLLQPGGRSTPLLDAVRAVWLRGGVVAGTSSGAAVLSAVAFRDAPDVLGVMQGRLREGREWASGFALLPPGVVVDQHFVRRGRIGRLLPLMQAQGVALGLGVEEDSAAIVRGDAVEVVGRHGVVVADLGGATHDAALAAFNLRGAVLHWLQAGDRYSLAGRSVQPAAARIALPISATADGAAFAIDMLAEGALLRAMRTLVEGAATELRGLSFAAEPAADDPAPELGFEWRLRRDAASRGWRAPDEGGASVAGVRLDIAPVRIRRPLYEILTPEASGQPARP